MAAMKRKYFIFVTPQFAVRVPRRFYNWVTGKTKLTGIVEVRRGD